MEELETTFYRFYSEVRSFLSKLITNPIAAQPSDYLQERKFNKTKLINILMKRGILERHETIKDASNSEYEHPTYVVQYKVLKKNFERNIKRIYIRFFERNVPEKKEVIDEDGATGCCSIGSCGYDVPFGGIMRKNSSIYNPKGLKENKRKMICITEAQLKYINEILNTPNAGDEDLKHE